jgi:hypothetical protein
MIRPQQILLERQNERERDVRSMQQAQETSA